MTEEGHAASNGLDGLSLPAMLSAALVAFTIECDNELELRYADPRHGGMISLVAWLNAMQHLSDGPASVSDICARTHTSKHQVAFIVGKLEHWGWVSQAIGDHASPPRRQAISAIKAHSTFTATDKGEAALELWPQAIDTVEARWRRRQGSTLTAALNVTSKLARDAGVLMPEGVPPSPAYRIMAREWQAFPPGRLDEPRTARIPVLLGRALLAATMAYDRRSSVPLALAANTLRVAGADDTPVARLHTRAGTPPETAASQCTVLESLALAEVVSDGARRVKLLRLTAAGATAQVAHAPTLRAIEAMIDPDGTATAAMRALLGRMHDGDLALRVALTPPAGTRRSGAPRSHGVKAPSVKARDRELAAQTNAFLADPFGSLPHYPIWEATRAFGP